MSSTRSAGGVRGVVRQRPEAARRSCVLPLQQWFSGGLCRAAVGFCLLWVGLGRAESPAGAGQSLAASRQRILEEVKGTGDIARAAELLAAENRIVYDQTGGEGRRKLADALAAATGQDPDDALDQVDSEYITAAAADEVLQTTRGSCFEFVHLAGWMSGYGEGQLPSVAGGLRDQIDPKNMTTWDGEDIPRGQVIIGCVSKAMGGQDQYGFYHVGISLGNGLVASNHGNGVQIERIEDVFGAFYTNPVWGEGVFYGDYDGYKRPDSARDFLTRELENTQSSIQAYQGNDPEELLTPAERAQKISELRERIPMLQYLLGQGPLPDGPRSPALRTYERFTRQAIAGYANHEPFFFTRFRRWSAAQPPAPATPAAPTPAVKTGIADDDWQARAAKAMLDCFAPAPQVVVAPPGPQVSIVYDSTLRCRYGERYVPLPPFLSGPQLPLVIGPEPGIPGAPPSGPPLFPPTFGAPGVPLRPPLRLAPDDPLHGPFNRLVDELDVPGDPIWPQLREAPPVNVGDPETWVASGPTIDRPPYQFNFFYKGDWTPPGGPPPPPPPDAPGPFVVDGEEEFRLSFHPSGPPKPGRVFPGWLAYASPLPPDTPGVVLPGEFRISIEPVNDPPVVDMTRPGYICILEKPEDKPPATVGPPEAELPLPPPKDPVPAAPRRIVVVVKVQQSVIERGDIGELIPSTVVRVNLFEPDALPGDEPVSPEEDWAHDAPPVSGLVGGDTGRDDIIFGGLGLDGLLTGGGDDTLRGGPEDDVIRGGGLDDLRTDGGADTLRGSPEDDPIQGGPGQDSLSGGPPRVDIWPESRDGLVLEFDDRIIGVGPPIPVPDPGGRGGLPLIGLDGNDGLDAGDLFPDLDFGPQRTPPDLDDLFPRIDVQDVGPLPGTAAPVPGSQLADHIHQELLRYVTSVTATSAGSFVTLHFPARLTDRIRALVAESRGLTNVEIDFCWDKQAGPDDPYYGSRSSWNQDYDDQWAVKRVGYTGADNSAWAVAGDELQPVTVAVVDTGLDWNHRDLRRDSIWRNPGETPGNGIDDDGNGYVDDVIGWDFVRNSNRPWDFDGHGTFVAGIIAAARDNGVGIAGINSAARVMVLRALNSFGHTRASFVARAVFYAVKNGARVINLSVGGPHRSRMAQAALEYAHANNCVVVVAAGNEGTSTAEFGPGGVAEAITVAATDVNDHRTAYSNWGPGIDLAAPGDDVLSLRARGTDLMRDIPGVTYTPDTAFVGDDSRYYRASGTSFAAPIVAGTASLLLARRPELTNERVKRILQQSARDVEIPGIDQYTGFGVLDAAAALEADPDFRISAAITGVEAVRSGRNTVLRVSGRALADQLDRYWIEIGAGEDPEKWKRVSDRMREPVDGAVLADLEVKHFRDAKTWVLRLIVRHRNGTTREARFSLKLG